MAFNVVRVGEYSAPHLSEVNLVSAVDSPPVLPLSPVGHVYHVSVDKSGEHMWISNEKGIIQKIRNTSVSEELKLPQIHTSGEMEGYHSATEDGGLIYADKRRKVIYRMLPGGTMNVFARTGDWEPLSVHLSRSNGDLLVGMKKQGEAKVTRYDMTGQEIQNIQKDNQGRELYEWPNYITENINGDVCTSDSGKRKVVVVHSSGQNPISYPDDDSEFRPFGICTVKTGHILVSDFGSHSVHVLNQDGSYLCSILSKQPNLFGICVVDSNNHICVGEYNSVIRYTQN